MWQVRAEEHDDATQVEALVARSFGPGRYAKSAYRLREGVAQETGLAFVAIEDDSLKGSVRFWPVAVGETRALLLGPLAVETNERGRGIGLALMERGIEEARSRGYRAVLAPLARASGGSVRWLVDGGLPQIRRVQSGSDASGSGWIGLRANKIYRVGQVEEEPLLPVWLSLLLLLGSLLLAWRIEAR